MHRVNKFEPKQKWNATDILETKIELLTLKTSSEITGLSINGIIELTKIGTLEMVVQNNGFSFITKDSLKEYLKNRTL